MNAFLEELKEIKFSYWLEQNINTSKRALNKEMTGFFQTVKKKGCLPDCKATSMYDLQCEIKEEIEKFSKDESNCDRLARIFDLIHVWGGPSGRGPYATTKSRKHFEKWKHYYLEGGRQAQKGNPNVALCCFAQIDGVGISFASKHLRFWSDEYPILDARMSLLLRGDKKLRDIKLYPEYLLLLDKLVKKSNTTRVQTEMALFAFSKNYFMNDALVFDASYDNSVNFDIAKRLSELPPAPKIK